MQPLVVKMIDLMLLVQLQDTDGQFIGLTAAEDMAFLLENNCVEQDDMKKNVSYWAEKLA